MRGRRSIIMTTSLYRDSILAADQRARAHSNFVTNRQFYVFWAALTPNFFCPKTSGHGAMGARARMCHKERGKTTQNKANKRAINRVADSTPSTSRTQQPISRISFITSAPLRTAFDPSRRPRNKRCQARSDSRCRSAPRSTSRRAARRLHTMGSRSRSDCTPKKHDP